jgi:hypothetical protein
MGVVKTSGITAFDIAALDSVDRAQPFGPAPNAIVSGDGNVYLHWEFHRDEVFACSTQGARPFIINTGQKNNEELQPPAPTPGPTKERGSPPSSPNDSREGRLLPGAVPGHGRRVRTLASLELADPWHFVRTLASLELADSWHFVRTLASLELAD